MVIRGDRGAAAATTHKISARPVVLDGVKVLDFISQGRRQRLGPHVLVDLLDLVAVRARADVGRQDNHGDVGNQQRVEDGAHVQPDQRQPVLHGAPVPDGVARLVHGRRHLEPNHNHLRERFVVGPDVLRRERRLLEARVDDPRLVREARDAQDAFSFRAELRQVVHIVLLRPTFLGAARRVRRADHDGLALGDAVVALPRGLERLGQRARLRNNHELQAADPVRARQQEQKELAHLDQRVGNDDVVAVLVVHDHVPHHVERLRDPQQPKELHDSKQSHELQEARGARVALLRVLALAAPVNHVVGKRGCQVEEKVAERERELASEDVPVRDPPPVHDRDGVLVHVARVELLRHVRHEEEVDDEVRVEEVAAQLLEREGQRQQDQRQDEHQRHPQLPVRVDGRLGMQHEFRLADDLFLGRAREFLDAVPHGLHQHRMRRRRVPDLDEFPKGQLAVACAGVPRSGL
mmetsp:Transcript_21652/g.66577  ORF Transcript_21652/g.66577 Transcript_21652/m.66577 type:complete len:465 (+) Transcript_21652:1766-3160(+)